MTSPSRVRWAWFAAVALTIGASIGPAQPQLKDVVAHRDLAYVAGGHGRQKLDLYLPAAAPAHPLPLIIWIHGGGWQSGGKGNCPPLRYGFLGRGYAIASLGYRLTDVATFPAQIEDCKAGVRWLRAHAAEHRLDAERFVAWGSSAGGHLAALLGTSGDLKQFDVGENLDVSSRVQAVIDYYGPSDFAGFLATPGFASHRNVHSPEARLLGGPLDQRRELAELASPITHVTKGDPPFLILHGSEDRTVPWKQSETLHVALLKALVPSELHILNGAGHGGAEFLNAQAIGWVTGFLERTVQAER